MSQAPSDDAAPLLPTVVIGTAGHIDHGKTSLLRALTGIDADRLPEERSRGMTIDVGYAHLAFDDGVELDFVDVPGHDRLIGNMLVGAGEIDAAMLVVAADDGPRQQTLEHLQLLDALSIDAGIAVITKADLVEAARLAMVTRDIAQLLARTSLAGAAIQVVSSTTGQGIGDLRVALRALRDRIAARPRPDRPMRLAVDRAFAVKGRGVVVTGTLRDGTLERGMTLRREPGGEPIRVREIQVHNSTRDRATGGRTALNVAGDGADAIRRGDVLTLGAGVIGTDRLLVEVIEPAELGPGAARTARTGAHSRLHLGTDQVDAVMRPLAARPGIALLTLDRETATLPGDRGVLRDAATSAVVGGIRMLDPRPPRGVSRRRMTSERLDALASAIRGGIPDAIHDARLELHGTRPDGGSLALAPDVRDAVSAAALEAVAAQHARAPMSAGLPLPRARAAALRRLRSLATIERRHATAAEATVAGILDRLVDDGRLARRGEALRDPSLGADLPAELLAAMTRLEAALATAAPPPLDQAAAAAGCPPEGVRALLADGRIVRLSPELAWATPTYHGLAATALEHARVAPLSPAAFRDATGTSRKYVLAILEDLDRRGILERTPAGHVPGPRAPAAPPAAPSP